MLVEEEVEKIAHQLCSAIVVHGDCSVDDMSVGPDRRADVRPLARNDLRHVRAEIQQVGLHPQATAVEAFECAKAACMSRPTKNVRVGAEAIRADHEDSYASGWPRKPDERGALVWA